MKGVLATTKDNSSVKVKPSATVRKRLVEKKKSATKPVKESKIEEDSQIEVVPHYRDTMTDQEVENFLNKIL